MEEIVVCGYVGLAHRGCLGETGSCVEPMISAGRITYPMQISTLDLSLGFILAQQFPLTTSRLSKRNGIVSHEMRYHR